MRSLMLTSQMRSSIMALLFTGTLYFNIESWSCNDCKAQSAAKFDEESTDKHLAAYAIGKQLLGQAERRILLDVAGGAAITKQHKEKLLMLLFLSLRGASDRCEESSRLLENLERFIGDDSQPAVRLWAISCIAFTFEDLKSGDQQEDLWFQRVHKMPKDYTHALFTALAHTKWIHPENRFSRIKSIYADPGLDLESRELLIELIFSGALSGGLRKSEACYFYRDLSEMPENSPILTRKMFSKLAVLSEASRAIEIKDKTQIEIPK